MVIYDINGNELLNAIITESAEHERELSKSNFVKLSWNSDSKTVIPAGSYIVPFSDNIKYRLLDKYAPSETATGFKYEPEFQHPLMLLSRIPFLYSTTDQDGKVVKQQEWQYEGLITDILQLVCDAINDVFGLTDNDKFTFTICGDVDTSVNVSISSNDILSGITAIAQACKQNTCEWHLSWEDKALYFGQVSINLGENVPVLQVHGNVQAASINSAKEDYYNCFYPQGSTKNMSRKAQVGVGNVATLARLGLGSNYPDGCIYINANGEIITKAEFDASNAIKQTLALSFDDVFPHIDLYAYNIRKRTRYLKNETTGEYEKDSEGNNKIYTVWYMRLAYPTTQRDDTKKLINTTIDNGVTHYWYDYTIEKKQVLQGYTLKGTFKVNTHTTNNQYDALSQPLVGQPNGEDGFELIYHEAELSIPSMAASGDSGVDVLQGDYEIKMYQNGNTIIPSNEADGLTPRGNNLPDYTCNMVLLYNIVMGDAEVATAQDELAQRALKEINRRTQDNNNYTVASAPEVFEANNPNLYIGQRVNYVDAGYQLTTRVIKLVTKLDYPFVQTITVGNQAVKGPISQLKEDVNNILSGNFDAAGINYSQALALIKNYSDSRFLRKDVEDTAQELMRFLAGIVIGKGSENSWRLDEQGRAHLTTEFLEVTKKAIFSQLEIRSLAYAGGNMIFSGAGSTIYKVIGLDAEGKEMQKCPIMINGMLFSLDEAKEYVLGDTFAATSDIKAFRCYLIADDGTTATMNSWRVGDQARCQTFDIQSGVYKDVSNRYYWRLVVGRGQVMLEDGKLYNYVDLANVLNVTYTDEDGVTRQGIGYDTLVTAGENVWCDIPAKGDKIVQEGNQYNANRQAMIELIIEGEKAPAFIEYSGINSFSLAGRSKTEIAPNTGNIFYAKKFFYQTTSGDLPVTANAGEWNTSVSYQKGITVNYNGNTWISTQDNNVGNVPSMASDKWQPYAISATAYTITASQQSVEVLNDKVDTGITLFSWLGYLFTDTSSTMLAEGVEDGEVEQQSIVIKLRGVRGSESVSADGCTIKACEYSGSRVLKNFVGIQGEDEYVISKDALLPDGDRIEYWAEKNSVRVAQGTISLNKTYRNNDNNDISFSLDAPNVIITESVDNYENNVLPLDKAFTHINAYKGQQNYSDVINAEITGVHDVVAKLAKDNGRWKVSIDTLVGRPDSAYIDVKVSYGGQEETLRVTFYFNYLGTIHAKAVNDSWKQIAEKQVFYQDSEGRVHTGTIMSLMEQNSNSINLAVGSLDDTRREIIKAGITLDGENSAINVTANKFTVRDADIDADHLGKERIKSVNGKVTLDFDNFKVNEDGTLEATNANISGTVKAERGYFGGYVTYRGDEEVWNNGFEMVHGGIGLVVPNDTEHRNVDYGNFSIQNYAQHTIAALGTNVLPSEIGDIWATAMFSNEHPQPYFGSRNYGIIVSAKGAQELNAAIYAEHGVYAGFRTYIRRVTDSVTLGNLDNYVVWMGTAGERTITLPLNPEDGHVIKIRKRSSHNVLVAVASGSGQTMSIWDDDNSSVTSFWLTYRGLAELVYDEVYKRWYVNLTDNR